MPSGPGRLEALAGVGRPMASFGFCDGLSAGSPPLEDQKLEATATAGQLAEEIGQALAKDSSNGCGIRGIPLTMP